MRTRLVLLLSVATIAAWPYPAARSAPATGLPAIVAGIVSGGFVISAGVPLSSGSWGTDYITVSHALSVGSAYAVIRDGLPYSETTPITACSNQYHGIDVLILRAASHRKTPVVEWGDPLQLKSGDELVVFVRREIHPEPVKVKFLHVNLLEWTKTRVEAWPRQWHNVMVGEGTSMPGFSGSPWVRDGKVFGLHKGRVQPPGQNTWFVVAETAAKVGECLSRLNYDALVPKE